ncbi:DUF3578 domain-containing protein [Nonomuraea sp. NPDC003709]|uniref:MrcB family domain-containing protein n=1 Tax=Nonomuraea sp. NPDC003709 TaxID=3154450 RepID=UPI0033B69509
MTIFPWIRMSVLAYTDLMGLHKLLAGVRAHSYGHSAGKEQPAQKHLEVVRRDLQLLVPAGMRVRVSGSGQSLPVIPWVAILDENITKTAQEGLYVVYLYRRDLSRVYLSMNQGATQHRRGAEGRGLKGVAAEAAACEELASESDLIRSHLSAEALIGMIPNIDLGAPVKYFLPRAYEYGNIASIEYDLQHLPSDGQLLDDLTRLRALYSTCIDIKDEIRAIDPSALKTTSGSSTVKKVKLRTPKGSIFRPKNSSEYTAYVKAHEQTRQRRHEALIEAFGTWVRGRGLVPNNNVHPRDLTVEFNQTHWLIEAKTVGANPEFAVREAIGQLVSYRHFLYREQGIKDPHLVGLFSEPIGEAFAQLLSSLDIESIWQTPGGWAGAGAPGGPGLLQTLMR